MELNSYFQLEKGLGKKKIIFGIVKKCIEQCFSTGVPWNLFGCALKTYHIPERVLNNTILVFFTLMCADKLFYQISVPRAIKG